MKLNKDDFLNVLEKTLEDNQYLIIGHTQLKKWADHKAPKTSVIGTPFCIIKQSGNAINVYAIPGGSSSDFGKKAPKLQTLERLDAQLIAQLDTKENKVTADDIVWRLTPHLSYIMKLTKLFKPWAEAKSKITFTHFFNSIFVALGKTNCFIKNSEALSTVDLQCHRNSYMLIDKEYLSAPKAKAKSKKPTTNPKDMTSTEVDKAPESIDSKSEEQEKSTVVSDTPEETQESVMTENESSDSNEVETA